MNQDWITQLHQQGASTDLLDFGDRSGEVAAAQTGSILVPLTDLGLIRVSGEDATDFLHNLLTNDVEGMPADGAGRFGFCTPKGRLLATLLMWRDGADLIAALAADLHAAILKKLSMYVLRSRVKLTDASSEIRLFGVAGPDAEPALATLAAVPATAMHTAEIAGGRILRLAEQRFIVAIGSSETMGVWQQLASRLPRAGLNAWRWLDIVAGLPQVTGATQEEFIPQMINYELVGGVSFKKGCYPGQEIVARTQYLGKIKRRMYRAHLASGQTQPGIRLYAPETADQPCGMVVTVADAPGGGQDVLAVIQTSSAELGRLYLERRDGPPLQLQSLPYPI